MVMFSDTIRQLESVASADLVPQATVDVLTAAYRAFRARSHHLSLAGAEAIVPRHRVRCRTRCRHPRMERSDGRIIRALTSNFQKLSHGRDHQPLIQPNAQNQYEVTAEDLPLSCPMPQMYLWNSHPRVYLPIEATGWAKCAYCGAEYTLRR